MIAKHPRIGFMQGRLSPCIEGKIQAFPWPYWEAEFALADSVGLSLMEWTLDQDRIFENPLMTQEGRARIKQLGKENRITIPSLTGDCFMQAPFWKVKGQEQVDLVLTFAKVLSACADVGVKYVVVPLVDNGALAGPEEQEALERLLLDFAPTLKKLRLMVIFESDFPPEQLVKFITRFPEDCFGINFDMGNSASLGWDPEQEIRLLANRIVNVHVKDRVRGGTTVPLGEGAVKFPKVFSMLKTIGYNGNYILQTARASDDKHLETLTRYTKFVAEALES